MTINIKTCKLGKLRNLPIVESQAQEVDTTVVITEQGHLHCSPRTASCLHIHVLHVQPNSGKCCTFCAHYQIVYLTTELSFVSIPLLGLYLLQEHGISPLFCPSNDCIYLVFYTTTRPQNYNLHLRYTRVHKNHVFTKYMYRYNINTIILI